MQANMNGCSDQNGTTSEQHKLNSLSTEAKASTSNGEAVSNGNGKEHKTPHELSRVDQDIVRLIGQHLRGLGFNQTAEQLISESGCSLEHPAAARFRAHVMDGQWDKTDDDLKDLESLVTGGRDDVVKMRFLLLEQKYLEQLEDGDPLKALDTLRHHLTPLKHNIKRVHELSTYMMCSSPDELRRSAFWEGKGPVSRQSLIEKLQEFLPATVMLPPRRLFTLLSQAVDQQCEQCPYHNTAVDDDLSSISLLTDHVCSKDSFPCKSKQLLEDHQDEVWHCVFSPDGHHLATGSKDNKVILWEVDMETYELRKQQTLDQHKFGAAFLSWSPDSRYLLVCGPEDTAEVYVYNTLTYEVRQRVHMNTEDSLTVAAWMPNGRKFCCGGIRGQFYYCDIDEGSPIDTWEGVRVQALAALNDAEVLAADSHCRIRAYNFENLTDYHVLKEEYPIMTFVLDEFRRYVLVSVQAQGVHLWDVRSGSLLRRFHGPTQATFTIYCCFGGLTQDFLASGSEESKLYIWHRRTENPVAVLEGHVATLNAASWNPMLPHMIATASDDRTVRIWMPQNPPPPPAPEVKKTLKRTFLRSNI